MSVTESLVSRKVQIKLSTGTDVNGNATVATRTYSNVSPTATAEEMHATAQALGTLMDDSVIGVYYDDKKILQQVSAED